MIDRDHRHFGRKDFLGAGVVRRRVRHGLGVFQQLVIFIIRKFWIVMARILREQIKKSRGFVIIGAPGIARHFEIACGQFVSVDFPFHIVGVQFNAQFLLPHLLHGHSDFLMCF